MALGNVNALSLLTFHLSLSLITPYIFSFHIIHKSLVYHPVTTGGRIVTGKIPVACIGRATFMQVFNGLINNFYRNSNFRRCNQLCNFI